MADELKPDAPVEIEAPSDFRAYNKWKDAGQTNDFKPVAAETPAKSPAPESGPEQPAAAEPTPQAKTVPQSGAESVPPVAEGEETDRGSPRDRRIDRLTRENELLKQQLAGMQPKPAAQPETPKPQEAPGKPKLHDYKTLEDYQEALTDWKLDQREAQKKAETQQAEAKTAAEKIEAAWSKSQDNARAAHTDYDELIVSVKAPEGPGVAAARQAMLEDENGGEILYHLASHPEELKRIAAMSPVSAVKEIGRLSVTLAPPTATAGNPKPAKAVSGAPRPPAPLSRPSAGTGKKDVMDEEFARTDFPGWTKERLRQLKG